MPGTLFSRLDKVNPHVLSEMMQRQMFRAGVFGRFVAPEWYKKTKQDIGLLENISPSFSGKPIDVFREFIKMGKTTMDIPVKLRLTEMPVHGDQPLKGKAESYKIAYRTIEINRTRKAVAPPTGMSRQIVKPFADMLMLAADKDLAEWYSNYWGLGNFQLTMLAGYSRDLVGAVSQGGLGKSYVSHPNFYVAGSGQVSYAGGRPGTSGYEASVEAALNGLTSTAEDEFSPALVEKLVIEAPRKKIGKIAFGNGIELYPIFIKDSQWNQYTQNSDFREVWIRQVKEMKDNPLFTGAYCIQGGAILYPDNSMFTAYTNVDDANVTAGTVEYGPRPTTAERGAGWKIGNHIQNIDTGSKAVAILVGQQMMSIGIGENMRHTSQEDDHGNLLEIGTDGIISAVRSDIYDQDGKTGLTAGDFYEHTGSLVCATNSPYNLTW